MPAYNFTIPMTSQSFPAGTPTPTKVTVQIAANADGTGEVTWKDLAVDPAHPEAALSDSFTLPVGDYFRRATAFAGTTKVGNTAVVSFSVAADVALFVPA